MLLKVDESDGEWKLVAPEGFHDPSQDMDLLRATSTRTESSFFP